MFTWVLLSRYASSIKNQHNKATKEAKDPTLPVLFDISKIRTCALERIRFLILRNNHSAMMPVLVRSIALTT